MAQRGQELARMNGAASHLALAHSIWGQVLRPGSIVVDATCGNGHDALAIAKCVPCLRRVFATVVDLI